VLEQEVSWLVLALNLDSWELVQNMMEKILLVEHKRMLEESCTVRLSF